MIKKHTYREYFVNDVEKRLYTMFVSLLGIKGTRKRLGTWKKRKHAEETIIKQQK
jgi:hypothetical protein